MFLLTEPNLCGRVDDVLLGSCQQTLNDDGKYQNDLLSRGICHQNDPHGPICVFNPEEKPDMLQMIVDDEIKQFL